jgi:hypothetical protein
MTRRCSFALVAVVLSAAAAWAQPDVPWSLAQAYSGLSRFLAPRSASPQC